MRKCLLTSSLNQINYTLLSQTVEASEDEIIVRKYQDQIYTRRRSTSKRTGKQSNPNLLKTDEVSGLLARQYSGRRGKHNELFWSWSNEEKVNCYLIYMFILFISMKFYDQIMCFFSVQFFRCFFPSTNVIILHESASTLSVSWFFSLLRHNSTLYDVTNPFLNSLTQGSAAYLMSRAMFLSKCCYWAKVVKNSRSH